MTSGRLRSTCGFVVVGAAIAAGCGATATPRNHDAGTIAITVDGGDAAADRPAADRPAPDVGGRDAATDAPVSLSITPRSVGVQVGTPVFLMATARLGNGSAIDVTASAVWISSDERIATVTAGRVTGQLVGSVTISA
jgi:hypothetical protein